MAKSVMKLGIPILFLPVSKITYFKFRKGLSKTTANILTLLAILSVNFIVVTAPIDLPHIMYSHSKFSRILFYNY